MAVSRPRLDGRVLRALAHADLDELLAAQREGAEAWLLLIFARPPTRVPPEQMRERWSSKIDDANQLCAASGTAAALRAAALGRVWLADSAETYTDSVCACRCLSAV